MSLITLIVSLVTFFVVTLFGANAFFDADAPQKGWAVEIVSTPSEVRSPADGWTPVELDGTQGVIIPETDAAQLVGEQEGYWTPTLADVEAAEVAILAAEGPLEHMRQYAGFIESGERKLWINGFCDATGFDWQREALHVLDGGDCYFTGIYNVDTNNLETFYLNGSG